MKFIFSSASSRYSALEENGGTLHHEENRCGKLVEKALYGGRPKRTYTIDIGSIGDILKLVEACPDGVIISQAWSFDQKATGCDYEIMLYDGLIE